MDTRNELSTRRLVMPWRRPKVGCWTTASPGTASKPQFYVSAPPETALTLVASLHSAQVQHTNDRPVLFLLPLQALFSATMRDGYKFGGLLSPLCATLGWGRGALKRGSRRKLSTCWKRSQKQGVRSTSKIAYICKKGTCQGSTRSLQKMWNLHSWRYT